MFWSHRAHALLSLVLIGIVVIASVPPLPVLATPASATSPVPPAARSVAPDHLSMHSASTATPLASDTAGTAAASPALHHAEIIGTEQVTSTRIFLPLVRRAGSGPLVDIRLNETTTTAGQPALTLTIKIEDSGDVSYPLEITINASTSTTGLPATYRLTEADNGQLVLSGWSINAEGQHTITVSASGPSETVTVEVVPPQNIFTLPATLILQTPIASSWFQPFVASVARMSATGNWRGFPEYAVPASPGAPAIISGVAQRVESIVGLDTNTCVYFGWEPTLTDDRETGTNLGQHPWEDPTFIPFRAVCSNMRSDGQEVSVGPAFVAPQLLEDYEAIAAQIATTEGVHLNVQSQPVGAVTFSIIASPTDYDFCNTGSMSVADPIDTRSGAFSLTERDLGIETGCEEVGLRFERAYSTQTMRPSSLSHGWVHTYEQRVIPQGSTVLVQGPRGSLLRFQEAEDRGAVYRGVPGSAYTLMKRNGIDTSDGWALVYRSRRVDLFNAAGQLVAQQDPNGNLLWFTYEIYVSDDDPDDTVSRLASVHAMGGRWLQFAYADAEQPTRLTSVSDHTGCTVQFGYDARDRLQQVTDPLGATSTYSYTDDMDEARSPWLLTEQRDALGEPVFQNTYDVSGRVIRQVNNLGQAVDLTYATITDPTIIAERVGAAEAAELAALLETTVTDQSDAKAIYTYGADGLLRRMQEPTNATTHYRDYTETRQPTEIEDALGNITRISYHADLGLPVAITDALGNATRIAYDTWGNPTAITDTLGAVTTFTYDANGKLTRVENPLGEELTFAYADQENWQGLLDAIVEPGNRTTTLDYNTAGDLTTITDALDRDTTLHYDDLGRPVTVVEPGGITTQLAYDAADQVTQMVQVPADPTVPERTTTLVYDAVGNLISVTDPLNHRERRTSARHAALPHAARGAYPGHAALQCWSERPGL